MNDIIRWCPLDKQRRDQYDLVYINWENEGKLPTECLFMIDFERTRLEKYSTSLYSYEGMDVLHQILGKKKSVIVTSTLARNDQINNLPRECHTKSITSNEEANFIMMRSEKFHSMEDKFQLVSV